MLRENFGPTDFVGLLGTGPPICQHEDLAFDHGRTSSQSGRLRVVQSDGRVANPGAPSPTRCIQAKNQETVAQKQGSVVLVLDVEDLEGLDIGIDSRETGDCHPMEEEEDSRVLVENVSGQDRQTCDSRRTHRFHPPDILGSSGVWRGSHCLGVGAEVWHSPRLLHGPKIHGQETCGVERFPGMEKLLEEPSQGHLVL